MCKITKKNMLTVHMFLYFPLLGILMVLGCNENINSNAGKSSMVKHSQHNPKSEEVHQVIQCLREFIRNKKNNQAILFLGIELNENLITHENVIIESRNEWAIDGWVVRKFNYPDTSSPDPKSVIIRISKGKKSILDAREVFWESGKWTGGQDWYIVASTGYQVSENELNMIFVKIEKTEKNLYQVTDWKPKNLMVEPIK